MHDVYHYSLLHLMLTKNLLLFIMKKKVKISEFSNLFEEKLMEFFQDCYKFKTGKSSGKFTYTWFSNFFYWDLSMENIRIFINFHTGKSNNFFLFEKKFEGTFRDYFLNCKI